MPRTAVAYSNLVANGGLTTPAGTAVSSGAGNGGQVANAAPEETVIRLSNASGGAGTVTLLAGSYPPAIAAGLGNATAFSVGNGSSAYIGPFESGRFLQADGSLIFETSVAMTATAFRVPRAV
ncbi:hypothetical protein Ait01nite_089520 [Actinoplanes italicus]|uniref:Uncharacterized protein n=1 Tax=Actinoplanes italicus TaxID=113567 RepID=A0A2T0JIG0_9ACTN|nr:hypothetical protein [Actinoplanes italicus]PRX07368.1 hypothetical protein CLV67_14243 [Actinoplanes italicus]GIE35907.1 hypothetical protein Ait01nite_089520 [Actinoplanes italicus]